MTTISLPPNVWTSVIGVVGLWDIDHRNTGGSPYRLAVGSQPPGSALSGSIFASGEGGDVTLSSSTIWAMPINAATGQITIDARSLGPSGTLVTPQDFGAVGDGVTDDGAAFQAFVDYLLEDPAVRVGTAVGSFVSATDIVNLHAVQIEGTGRLRIGAGDWWRFGSNEKNSGFGGLGYNTIYAAPGGSATASGLSTTFPVSVVQAVAILGKLSAPLQGLYRIVLAEGVYTTPITLFDIEASRGKPLYIQGPAVDTWSKAAAPIVPKAITSITSANPPVVTCNGHGYSNGDKVFIGFAKDAGGAHDGDGAIYTVAGATTNTFQLSGVDGSGWGAYTGSGILFSCNGSAPKAIFYGSGAGSGSGISIDGSGVVFISDIAGIGWGSRTGSLDEGFIRASITRQVRLTNVHPMYCSAGVTIRDETNGLWFSGRAYECQSAAFIIHARYTIGISNPTSIPDTTPIIQNCTFGVHAWEMSSGHADGLTMIDCSNDFRVRKNAHMVAIWNQITNTGAAKNSITAEDGSYLAAGNNNFTGSFATRVRRLGYSTRNEQGIVYGWLTRSVGGVVPPTPGGAELTLRSITVPQGEMAASPQSIRVNVHYKGTWSNDTFIIRLKLGATTLYTHTFGANANAREGSASYVLRQDGFGNVRIFREEYEAIGGTTTPRLDHDASAFSTSSGDQTFAVTGQVTNAGDVVFYLDVSIETLGW